MDFAVSAMLATGPALYRPLSHCMVTVIALPLLGRSCGRRVGVDALDHFVADAAI